MRRNGLKAIFYREKASKTLGDLRMSLKVARGKDHRSRYSKAHFGVLDLIMPAPTLFDSNSNPKQNCLVL